MKNPKTSSKKSSQDAKQRPAKLRLSRSAAADFDAIDAYSFEQFGEDVSDDYMRGFDELFDTLRRYPNAGTAEPSLGKGIRKLSHREHRIFYTVNGDFIFVARIVHHAMDAARALKKLAK